MEKINYKSDFDFILKLIDCNGKDIGVPDYDWTAKLYTSKAYAFTASHKDGVFTNCFNDNGQIHIVCDNHGLPPGKLRCEFTAELPNDIYPDDSERQVLPQPLDIELTREASSCPHDLKVELILPMLKGDKGDRFTFEDFTTEQIADLQKPAVEAARRADTATQNTEKATEKADKATKDAEKAISDAKAATEKANQAASDATGATRNAIAATSEMQGLNRTVTEDEEKRALAESLRESAEKERKADESSRATAEQSRDEAEKERESAETERATKEDSRIANEQTRINNEKQRVLDEAARQRAENARATEFTQIKADAETATGNANAAAQSANKAATNASSVATGLASEIAGKQEKLTDSEDVTVEGDKLTVTERAKRSVLLEIFKLRGGKNLVYDEQGDVFSLNGVPDLTWTDMENILFWSDPHLMSQVQSNRYYGCPCKTLFGIDLGTYVNLASAFIYSKLQVIVFNGWYRDNAGYYYSNAETAANAFQSCGSLREIRGVLKDSAKCSWNLTFNGCKALEEVRIASLQHSILLNASPAISLATLDFMITYAANTAAITITVHPDVYAKLTDETNVEWHQVLLDAAEKNIQFASA